MKTAIYFKYAVEHEDTSNSYLLIYCNLRIFVLSHDRNFYKKFIILQILYAHPDCNLLPTQQVFSCHK